MSLRLADPADGAALAAIYAPIVEHTAISFEWHPPSPAEMADRVASTVPAHPWLVAVAGDAGQDEVVGYAYAGAHAERASYRWSTNVSVYVSATARRRGVGRMLYRALIAVLEAQGYRQAFAGITLPNDASVRLHESVGFVPVGVYRDVGWKLGKWHDVGYWQLVINPGSTAGPAADAPPTGPTPLSELAPGIIETALRGAR